ncbi:MAG: murein biosynthesis integral membrane protein MurJ [Candidatus Hydrogenedentes bacterium]|nr:murein biosynthesis integral membrane protein MurJ [Candidatus Hydrogenedentota bacterium]
MQDSDRSTSRFAIIFAAGTLISRVLGVVRDQVINVFLLDASREAFIVAFRFPNMLRDLVGEGAANAAFVPVFSATLEKRGEKAFREVVAASMGGMILLLGALSVLGVLLVPELLRSLNAIHPLTGGEQLSPETIALASSLSRWMFPYLFWIGLSVFSMSALFTVKHYGTPSWAPALLNVCLIGAAFFFRDTFSDPSYALVVGVWAGGVTQVLVQYVALAKYAGVWRPSLHLRQREIFTMLALMGPVIIGQAAGEVNKLVDTLFAYKSAVGSVTALYNANRLVQLPLSIFGFAVAAAVLPAASRAAARDDFKAVRALLMQGMRQSFFMIAPSTLGLIVLGEPIVRLLFEYGHFSPRDTEWTSIALSIYAVGLIAFAWVKVAVTGFFAVHNTKTPVIVSSMSMVLNIILNVILVGPYGYKGLAFATSVSYFVNFLVLYILLCRRYGALWDGPLSAALLRMAVSTAIMSAVAYAAYVRTLSYFPGDSIAARLAAVAIPLAAAVMSYLFASWCFGIPELKTFSRILFRRRG